VSHFRKRGSGREASLLAGGPGAGRGGSAGPAPAARYVEVVRNKDARAAMPAHDCEQCAKVSARAGPAQLPAAPVPRPLRAVPPATALAHTRCPAPPLQFLAACKDALSPGGQQRLVQQCSRHRAQYRPQETPPGYWDIGIDEF
jgi:hypothetical protein